MHRFDTKLKKVVAMTVAATFFLSACSIDQDQLQEGLDDLADAVADETDEETVATDVSVETDATETTELTEPTETEAPTETPAPTNTPKPTNTPTPTPDPFPALRSEYEGLSAEEICSMLTLEEKAAQMVEPGVYEISDYDMLNACYGSVLGRFDAFPFPNDVKWLETVNNLQAAAISSDAGIPYIYGQDSVHGINTADSCVIFPHNINIGAANDADLAYEIGVVTGSDMLHTGMIMNFSPCVADAQDPRWGRTYESYSSDLGRVTDMSVAYTQGMLSQGVIVCAKHYFGDGDVVFGTGEGDYLIDRGDAQLSEEEIQARLDVYQALIDEGVQVIMPSHSSLNGLKMHENEEYLMKLKNEMGFEGMIITDWESLHNCSGETYADNIILCINAGCDMLMEPAGFDEARDIIVQAVNDGKISEERIDDAVTRILRVKIAAGLFEDPYFQNREPAYDWNSDYSHEIARQAAAESFVVLKDDGPMELTEGMRVFVTGPAADDMGVLCGGWTNNWQGMSDEEAGMEWRSGNTILEALEDAADEIGFEIVTDADEIDTCDVVLLCVGEIPYAEWYGDAENLSITGDLALPGNAEAIALAEEADIPTITLIVAGRNVLISNYIDDWATVIMCYLPGTEGGNAVADVLTGAAEAGGTLPMPYYSSEGQIGSSEVWHDVGYSATVSATAQN